MCDLVANNLPSVYIAPQSPVEIHILLCRGRATCCLAESVSKHNTEGWGRSTLKGKIFFRCPRMLSHDATQLLQDDGKPNAACHLHQPQGNWLTFRDSCCLRQVTSRGLEAQIAMMIDATLSSKPLLEGAQSAGISDTDCFHRGEPTVTLLIRARISYGLAHYCT